MAGTNCIATPWGSPQLTTTNPIVEGTRQKSLRFANTDVDSVNLVFGGQWVPTRCQIDTLLDAFHLEHFQHTVIHARHTHVGQVDVFGHGSYQKPNASISVFLDSLVFNSELKTIYFQFSGVNIVGNADATNRTVICTKNVVL
jgi:hypothetical protein